MRAKRTSIYTIGKELGVSPATVSRALSHHPAVSAGVRARVQAAAAKCQFKPRVVSNRVTNLCVLIQQYDGHPLDFSAFLSQELEGVAQYCRHEKLEMSLYSAHIQELNHCDLVRELRRRGADGAIVIRANDQTEYLAQLEDQHFPYLCLMTGNGRGAERLLGVDDEQLACAAVEHLIGLGHRRIGMLNNAPFALHGRRRMDGYRKALAAHGLVVDESLTLTADSDVHHGDFDFGSQAIDLLLERAPHLTAVFASSEETARGVLFRLYQQGISVPAQVSVVGFDDYPGTAYTCPPLTTVRIPYLEIGYEGARQVHRMCRKLGMLLPEKVAANLVGRLVIRESTTPAVSAPAALRKEVASPHVAR